MTTTLITGSNKGLGRETARRLLAAGHDVYISARDGAAGRAAAEELGARFVQLDVMDDASVEAAAARIKAEAGRLDVLVNNAGIPGGFVQPGDLTGDDVDRVLQTNAVGMVRVTHAFLPLLAESEHPVIVNVASGLGSFGLITDPGNPHYSYPTIAYSMSKAAVTMYTVQLGKVLPNVKVNAVDPGYTATDLNGFRGEQTVEEGAEPIVRMALIGADGPTCTFQGRQGELPW
jgi:NAD(P)-dependent dehydrogenase (short-subunit alcohol dehydrogenase family)